MCGVCVWVVCGWVGVCVCVVCGVGVVYTRSIDNLGFTCVEHLSNLPCHQSLASTCGNEWASYIIYTKEELQPKNITSYRLRTVHYSTPRPCLHMRSISSISA